VAGTGTPRWHVDRLRAKAEVRGAWFVVSDRSREHDWARLLLDLPGVEPGPTGFGASDCRCETHLFRSDGRPAHDEFRSGIRRRWRDDIDLVTLRIGSAAHRTFAASNGPAGQKP
jgi:Uri superfamily endonuclease